MDESLMVIVPRNLPSRLATLSQTLAGTTIQVVADRREGQRRRSHQAAVSEQRHGDRRVAPRVVAYVYACPVIAVAAASTVGASAGGF